MTTVKDNVFPQVLHSILTAHPASPPTGIIYMYRLDDGKWYEKDSAGTVTEIGAQPTVPDNLADATREWTPPGSEHAISDEFDDASLDADWVRVDSAGEDTHLTYAEAAGALSMLHDGTDAIAEFHGLVRPLEGLSHPASFVTALRMAWLDLNYSMVGLVLADGVTPGAGQQQVAMLQQGAGDGHGMRMRDLSGWDTSDAAGTATTIRSFGELFYIRLRWTAANSFAFDYSIDGVQWYEQATMSQTITPTHVGFALSSYGGATHMVASASFFRAYSTSPTPPA